jgi:UDP-GlcNAc:undecaprenyl-phosphate/decaprenyl-phosphate GlcNAc-1-phosphate transferase
MKVPLSFYLVCFMVPFLGSLLSLPWWHGWCLRHQLLDEPGERKLHLRPIPLAGGPAVLTGMSLALLATVLLAASGAAGPGFDRLWHDPDRPGGQWAAVLAGALGMTVIGWLDDRHELRPGTKFLAQLLVAGLVSVSGVRASPFGSSPLVSQLISILWILAVTNALNFQDNMDGLCTGLTCIAATGLGLNAVWQGLPLVAGLALMTAGAAAGFLPHNFPQAKAFLGDSGSHLLGFLLAVLALLPQAWSANPPPASALWRPLLILGVPLADLAWVVGYRLWSGRAFYMGDTNHFSHQLERIGLSRAGAVITLWAAAAACGALAVLL